MSVERIFASWREDRDALVGFRGREGTLREANFHRHECTSPDERFFDLKDETKMDIDLEAKRSQGI